MVDDFHPAAGAPPLAEVELELKLSSRSIHPRSIDAHPLGPLRPGYSFGRVGIPQESVPQAPISGKWARNPCVSRQWVINAFPR